MLRVYIGLIVMAGSALAGCLTTQYQDTDEAAYQTATARTQAPVTTRRQTTLANVQTLRCPAGTKPHARSGSCLMVETPATAPARTYAAVSTPRQPSQNFIRANTQIQGYPTTQGRQSFGAANYRVETGDTVYSLARQLCVPVSVIQIVNGLDASYHIKAGQGLSLPRSQC